MAFAYQPRSKISSLGSSHQLFRVQALGGIPPLLSPLTAAAACKLPLLSRHSVDLLSMKGDELLPPREHRRLPHLSLHSSFSTQRQSPFV